jgi:hypothetical protein
VEQLLEEVWVGPAAAALNPTWQSGAPGQYQALVDSFNAVYSFLPISLQVGARWGGKGGKRPGCFCRHSAG